MALLLPACGNDLLGRVRTVTYPPDFQYLTRTEIRSTMGALAAEVDALDQIMWQPGGPQTQDRDRVVSLLSEMQRHTAKLTRSGVSNHPRIDQHGPRLQRDVARALTGARREPPNYYYAGLVTGSCTYCHAPRHRLPPAPPEL